MSQNTAPYSLIFIDKDHFCAIMKKKENESMGLFGKILDFIFGEG